MCNRLDESVWVNMMCTCILLAFPVIFEDYHLCKSALRGTVKYSRQYYRILWDLAEISYYKMLYSEFCSEINAAHFPSEHNTFITVLNAGNHTVIVYSSWLKTFVTRLSLKFLVVKPTLLSYCITLGVGDMTKSYHYTIWGCLFHNNNDIVMLCYYFF